MTTNTAVEIPNELDAYIDSLGLEYGATFVPQSQSRNADEKHKSINWIVTITKGRQTLTTDYMQGIAHIPKASGWHKLSRARRTLEVAEHEKLAAEQGKYCQRFSCSFGIRIPAPKLKDVLYSLVTDSDVINYPNYEDWASCFGYDEDSRKGEQLYKDCLEIALKLRSIIGQTALDKLTELFQDY